MVRRSRCAALVLVVGAMTLSPARAAAAPGPVGPPPKLPDVGPPPALPDFGSPNMPPSDPAGPPPAAPPPSASPAPKGPPPGPPVMRPTIRAPAPTVPAPSAPAPSAPAPSVPPAAPPATVAPPPVSETAATTVPPPGGTVPAAPPPVSPVSSAPPGDPSLQAPVMEGVDPVAPEEPPKAAPEPKTRDEEEEEAARARRKTPKKWRHAGLIVEPRFGVLGCTRQFCAGSQGHQERPGALLGGFIGGNTLGLVDIGIEAQWATLRPGDLKGDNAVTLYGLDPPRVEQALSERLGMEVDVDFDQLIVTSAKARSVSAGPALRIHFLRKGRGVAYVGTGIHYQLWRNRYETTGGPTRIDFHGFQVPFRVGGGAFVHPNIAVTGEFAYHYAFYVLTGVSHPELSGFSPITVIEGAALDAGANLRKGLPHFWSFTVSVRFRLGL